MKTMVDLPWLTKTGGFLPWHLPSLPQQFSSGDVSLSVGLGDCPGRSGSQLALSQPSSQPALLTTLELPGWSQLWIALRKSSADSPFPCLPK